jgi:hypothetical protein
VIIRDHNFGEFSGEFVCFCDDPNAGLRAFCAGDNPTEIIVADTDLRFRVLSAQAARRDDQERRYGNSGQS